MDLQRRRKFRDRKVNKPEHNTSQRVEPHCPLGPPSGLPSVCEHAAVCLRAQRRTAGDWQLHTKRLDLEHAAVQSCARNRSRACLALATHKRRRHSTLLPDQRRPTGLSGLQRPQHPTVIHLAFSRSPADSSIGLHIPAHHFHLGHHQQRSRRL